LHFYIIYNDNYMNDDVQKMFDSLKELINTKFDELEKREKLQSEYIDLKINNINTKNDEQDARLKNLEDGKKNTVSQIIPAIINCVVPFVLLAILFYIKNGKQN